jgi:hypothetical protein
MGGESGGEGKSQGIQPVCELWLNRAQWGEADVFLQVV